MKKVLPLKNKFIKIVFAAFLCIHFASISSAFEGKSGTISFPQNTNSDELTLVSHSFQVLSTNEYGATYILEVTNNSALELNLDVTAVNNNSDIENPDHSPISENVELKSEFYDVDYKKHIESIHLKAGDSYKFKVTIDVPENTVAQRWNCTKVELSPDNKGLSQVSILLHTYVSDLTQD